MSGCLSIGTGVEEEMASLDATPCCHLPYLEWVLSHWAHFTVLRFIPAYLVKMLAVN